MELKRIAIDTSKHVFTLHRVDADRAVLRREGEARATGAFFGKPHEVVLEACGGSHHWSRFLSTLGHTMKLITAMSNLRQTR